MVDQKTDRQLFAQAAEVGSSELTALLPPGGQQLDGSGPSGRRFQPFDRLVLPRGPDEIYGAKPRKGPDSDHGLPE